MDYLSQFNWIKVTLIFFILSVSFYTNAQSYTSYFTGNSTDLVSDAHGGICMMGGATEHDEAMKWFLQRANGGDVLVLRTSGSDGYNDYMYSELGVNINSVETIVFNNSTGANDSYIHQKIQKAEAIWFAGGNQWNYVSYWRNTPIDSLINEGLLNRNIVIGGTSAGMAIQGKYYFSAQNGTVTSAEALANPYRDDVTVDSLTFLKNNYLQDVVTDSHYDDPNRKGRHVVFMARILTDYGISAKGIACNEYTAVCIDENGLTKVFGDYPNYEEAAYFLQTNCELDDMTPEICLEDSPLDWNRQESAIRVYKVYGTNDGHNTFDLSDWETGEGGSWHNWYVNDGDFVETTGVSIDCGTSSLVERRSDDIEISPNPFIDQLTVKATENIINIDIFDLNGNHVFSKKGINERHYALDLPLFNQSVYLLKIRTTNMFLHEKIVKF